MARLDTHYLGLIHKDEGSGYGVSFPDVPGVIAVADSLDEAISEAAAALDFAFEDWSGALPTPRTLDQLRNDPQFLSRSEDAVVAAIRPSPSYYAAAE
ncbi:type II toxin-antitoxin system HicB family antitoxin [Devosia aurantiaca]|uniref:HicB family protein n=1 Tax=Devosia aurantiaca TaxID=2714858 RepID=A0A6M1SR44_9HYPH|nr:type II toxin-antitoxin system HicB family antitoxin [Devosia aurantiaca]NGP16863.1 HicB family protein [Devosia aurantiaca]